MWHSPDDQPLFGRVANRHHQPTADRELIEERLRNRQASGGDHDRIERRVLPAEGAITAANVDAEEAEVSQPRVRQDGLALPRSVSILRPGE